MSKVTGDSLLDLALLSEAQVHATLALAAATGAQMVAGYARVPGTPDLVHAWARLLDGGDPS
jgi:hypothetical protein